LEVSCVLAPSVKSFFPSLEASRQCTPILTLLKFLVFIEMAEILAKIVNP